MAKPPATPATQLLKARKVAFTARPYDYVDHGGTGRAASELGVDEHAVVKTLVFEDESGRPFLVLMHGDREVSLKELARQMGVKSVTPCAPEAAQRHTGYLVGGISPFATRKPLPVCLEKSILALPRVLVNAGRRGVLVEIEPRVFQELLSVTPVEAGR
ncbi:Cys-tRNA(Pro)/Cys-tRNA(Cys) deacylase YbaK [Fundidesulfovibrio magnetotacticus]|uniref:Cys-tRNA(Pro)/Cys-tRNA(Cys) deacylase n=1 Tax=Fundidesulfovibrio magnetotacticus TaxID=2730080 RepID=A0A6V8LVL7_9BACT|nr:aminoacyl-tRNA deacylase [Fundidesulfovibrio magnetotacticus]GFK94348.1 Cys-tRNA(Pro)/Cys-tRNA(Cys) deacylase YbaK [Fundidesulfovibrio magnetotacticus]